MNINDIRESIIDGDFDVDIKVLLKEKYKIKKIICLHGGGENGNTFKYQQGMQDLINNLPNNYEFIFADTPEDNNVWIKDPPGGKDNPTTDINWASNSITYLNNLIQEHSPVHALLGYSQGSAMIAVYLAYISSFNFNKVLLFNGYLPETHQGLMSQINDKSPYDISSLIFAGKYDDWFAPLAPALRNKFINPLYISRNENEAGHNLPLQNDPSFQTILNFIL